MQTSTFVWIIVVLVIVLGAGWYIYGAPAPAAVPVNETPPSGHSVPDTSGEPGPGGTDTDISVDADVGVGVGDASAPATSASVTYGPNGFSPQEVIIKVGGTVTWTNSGGGSMWVASAQHPTHTAYSGTSLAEHCDGAGNTAFDQCQNGSTYSFTFDKVGTWGYHNHSNSSHFGRVVVIE
jgi:plastocyanin